MDCNDVQEGNDADYWQHPCALHVPLLRDCASFDEGDKTQCQSADRIDAKAEVFGHVATARGERYYSDRGHYH